MPFPANTDNALCVHLGCGSINHPVFVNVDILPFSHVHYVHRVDRLSMFKDNTVDLIYVSHCLEHFPYSTVLTVLKEWKRVLKNNGLLRLSVPDFDLLLAIYHSTGRDLVSIISPLLGGQDYKYNFHYSVFNQESLTVLLEQAGFRNVQQWIPGDCEPMAIDDWSSRTICIAGRQYPVSLNIEAVK